jgi:hypothetical protein
MRKDRTRNLALLLSLATALGFVGGYFLRDFRAERASEPDLSPIQHHLESTAERAIQPPKLSDAVVELRVNRMALDSEVDRVKHLAITLGGSAIGDASESDRADILANIPENAVETFTKAVRDSSTQTVEHPNFVGQTKVFVEIKLTSAG